MLELLLFAFIGSAAAGLWDLRTTEVPDEIPVLMSAAGLFYWFMASLAMENIYPFVLSLSSGLAFLVPGMILYKQGKWGAADAWVPASVMFLLPAYNGQPLLADYILNFLIVSSAYMIIYSLILGAMNRQVFSLFVKDLASNRWTKIILLAYAGVIGILAYIFAQKGASVTPLLISYFTVVFLVAFWRYATVVESNVFRKTVNAAAVKEGDVLEDMIWIGLTKEQAESVRKKGGKAVIKEGVRFVPVFPITLVVTALYGNLLFYLLL
ncbi:MAG: prepilin peptidase [Candidatus Aenigmarchaeota archaeon]|nr:prepilin peptidase [Candidatus Aenigmarchaeota archaeon]